MHVMYIVSWLCCSELCVFVKQKTADEMRISDWSSDVCSSDLRREKKTGTHMASNQCMTVAERQRAAITRAAILAIGDPTALATKGTVRLARGLTSIR